MLVRPPSAPKRPWRDPFADPVALALVDAVCDRGFDGTNERDVACGAGITQEEFDSRFRDLEDCALQTYDAFIDDFKWHIGSAYFAGEEWREGLRAAAYAAADWLTENPKLAQFGLVEVLKAKNEMLRVRREEVSIYCASLIDQGRRTAPDPSGVPAAAPLMAVGSILQLMTHRLQTGVGLDAHRSVPQLMFLVVCPYLGLDAAREELRFGRPSGARPQVSIAAGASTFRI